MAEPKDIERRLRAHFATEPPDAAAVWLFGSVSRGTAGEESDVDLGLLLGRPPGRRLEDQPFELARALGRVLHREVQVVVLDEAPADLVHRVLRDGLLVFESDASARIAFEVAKRNEYFDLLPVLEEYRRAGRQA